MLEEEREIAKMVKKRGKVKVNKEVVVGGGDM